MGIIVNKNDGLDDELSRRISADLRARVIAEEEEQPDFAEDVAYMDDFKKTGRFGCVWIVLVALAILSAISIVML
jgi:hypothetical protein